MPDICPKFNSLNHSVAQHAQTLSNSKFLLGGTPDEIVETRKILNVVSQPDFESNATTLFANTQITNYIMLLSYTCGNFHIPVFLHEKILVGYIRYLICVNMVIREKNQ